MKNFINSNDIYPILELIDKQIQRDKNKGNRDYFNKLPDYDDHDIEEISVFRDGDTITGVLTRYFDGTTETLTLDRGCDPPVPSTVPDWEYINTRLLMGYTLDIISPKLGDKSIQGILTRENGYGRITGLKQVIS